MAKGKSTKGQTTINKIYKTKDRVTRTPLKTGGELGCSGRIGSSCSTSGTRRDTLSSSYRAAFTWHECDIFKTLNTYLPLVSCVFYSSSTCTQKTRIWRGTEIINYVLFIFYAVSIGSISLERELHSSIFSDIFRMKLSFNEPMWLLLRILQLYQLNSKWRLVSTWNGHSFFRRQRKATDFM